MINRFESQAGLPRRPVSPSFRAFKNLLLQSHCPPKIAAQSIAVGVFLAFSPLVGLHFFLVIFIAKFTRLNPILLVAGVLVHNPWTILPIHLLGLATGDLLLYGNFHSWAQISALPWDRMGVALLWSTGFWAEHKHLFLELLKPFFLGSLVTASLAGSLANFLSLHIASKIGHPFLDSPQIPHDAPIDSSEIP